MEQSIGDAYFQWLCAQVVNHNSTPSSVTYWNLFTVLHEREFVFTLSGDDNRAGDGVELRMEFLSQIEADIPHDIRHAGASIFEVLIAFSRRAAFMTDMPAYDWFWIMINNLGLLSYTDAYDGDATVVGDILDRFIWRQYDYNGHGGLFPMHLPRQDQRNIEIWEQFSEYLVDQQL